jgi:AraC family L-rhamnose operon regulatory protein RhaS
MILNMGMTTHPTFRGARTRYSVDQCGPQTKAVADGKIEFHALSKGHYPGTRVPENVLPGLNSIGFWNASGEQDWGEDPHRNEGVEILFLETGATGFAVDQKKFNLHAGHFTITRPWQLHKLGAPHVGRGRLFWLIIDVGVRRPHQTWHWPEWVVLTKNDMAELTRKLRNNENPVWNSTPAIHQAFRELTPAIIDLQQPHAVSRLAVQLNQLLVGILDALSGQEVQDNEQLTSRRRTAALFLRDIEQGIVDIGEQWTLDKMSAHCGMGITAFSKYCRQLVNAGPMEFLNQRRLDKAARQLREDPSLSVTEIAFRNGFNASQYFATCFRRRFGCAPQEYRRRETMSKAA